jgi:hypothetical protein
MFGRRARTRLILHPIPPGKAQTRVWKQPHPLIQKRRPWILRTQPAGTKMFLPVNAAPHRDAIDRTKLTKVKNTVNPICLSLII